MKRSLSDIFLDAFSEALWVILERREPVRPSVQFAVGNQQSRRGRENKWRSDVVTKRIKSDEWLLIDPDFEGRLSGKDTDVPTEFVLSDPGDIGELVLDREEMRSIIDNESEFERLIGATDKSLALFVPTPGSGGIASVTWVAGQDQGLVEVQVEGENARFADTKLEVGNQSEPGDDLLDDESIEE
jgi:hypothetical protein